MQSPYTSNVADAYIAAQSSLGVILSAVAWSRRVRPWPALALTLFAIWSVVLLPAEGAFFQGLGVHVAPELPHTLLAASSVAMVAAISTTSPRFVGVIAATFLVLLWKADNYFTESDLELANLHLVSVGALLGMHGLARESRHHGTQRERGDYVAADALTFIGATFLAALVSTVVLERSCDSADEWSYTFQAATFAKGRAYAAMPPCSAALQNFWVFWSKGKMFSQYTPGWPLFAAPFQALNAMWMAAPVSHGLLAVAVARLGRRAAAASVPTIASVRELTIAGLVAAGAVATGSTMLINGASRFPHTFVCALFAWLVEATCEVSVRGIDPRKQRAWGVVLGLSAAFILGTRASDGGFLGCGVLIYFLYALARRRVSWTATAFALVSFSAVTGFILVILRLQLGAWFKTGYSLTQDFYPWNKLAFSWPHPNEYKWSIPLATGTYCWWPCAPALGVAGLAVLARSAERRIAFMLTVGVFPLIAFYTAIEWGRGWDFGYGPRYEMPLVVPMAVGSAVVLAPMVLWGVRSVGGARVASARAALAVSLVAALMGVVRIAPLVYPFNHEDVRLRNVVFRAVRDAHIHNAVVIISQGSTVSDQLDLTQNLPLDLYPNQDVIYVSDRTPEVHRCLRETFSSRTFYRTQGRPEVTLQRQ